MWLLSKDLEAARGPVLWLSRERASQVEGQQGRSKPDMLNEH